MKRLFSILLLILLILAVSGCTAPLTKQVEDDESLISWDKFEAELDTLRQEMKIPGMSAAVVKDGELAWAHGFGYADIENQNPATPETPYHLASVTKTFAAVILMQLVQEGTLSMDDPVSRYGVNLPEGDAVLVRHLMSHTSEGTPGASYQYNGMRYGLLSQVVLSATGRSLQELVYERILLPLDMEDTAPSPPAACAGLDFAPACERVYASLAQPYLLDLDYHPLPGYNEDYFNAGAGLISTVVDLAKFDAALDANILLTEATRQLMWTPSVSNSGQDLPYGLGWFTQSYRGTRLIWHSGFSPPSTSALFLKLPDEGLTFIMLANTDLLSRSYQAGHGNANDVLSSLVALTFYKYFVLAPNYDQPLPDIDWSADDATIQGLIGQVQYPDIQDILYKEFQARKSLASSLSDLKASNELIASMRSTAEKVADNLDQETHDLYVGTYEFPEAGGLTLTVTRSGNNLYVAQPGAMQQELLPLSTTRFFVPHGYDFYQFDFSPDVSSGTCRLVMTIWGMSFTGSRQ